MDKDKNQSDYIPALRYSWLTSIYDPVLRWLLREDTFKRLLVEQAKIEQGHRVLDLGCGTGTLTLLVKATHPGAEVVGLDSDPKALGIATSKASKAGLSIALDVGMSFDLPYPESSFDRVLSSLLFHHLTSENKLRTLREVHHVLRPGGELHVVDWGKPQSAVMRAAFLLVQALDGFKTTADNARGVLPDFIRDAGFGAVEETAQYTTATGTLSLYKAIRPLEE